jgi:hypothetical protein
MLFFMSEPMMAVIFTWSLKDMQMNWIALNPTIRMWMLMQEKVMQLHSQGKSLREIGSETGLSKNKVDRLIKKSVPVSRFPSGTGQSDENNLQSTDNQQVTENGSVPPLGQQSIEWDSSGTAVGQPF